MRQNDWGVANMVVVGLSFPLVSSRERQIMGAGKCNFLARNDWLTPEGSTTVYWPAFACGVVGIVRKNEKWPPSLWVALRSLRKNK